MVAGLASGAAVVAAVLFWRPGGRQSRVAPSAPPQAAVTAAIPNIDISGTVTAITDGQLVVPYGRQEYHVHLGSTTRVTYLSEPQLRVETGSGASVLKVGDTVDVVGWQETDGSVSAGTVARNSFIDKGGKVLSVAGRAVDVRLLVSWHSNQYEATGTTVLLAANALDAQSLQAVDSSALRVGQFIAFQGFTTEDGSLVISDLDASGQPPTP